MTDEINREKDGMHFVAAEEQSESQHEGSFGS